MIRPNLENICEHSKLYYYDYLFEIDQNEIPEHILSHIKQCEYCKSQIYQLKTALKQSEQTRPFVPKKSGTHIANTLKNHFSYIDQETTCTLVKPFLPGMLDTSTQISIPTPITAHLDNCPECVRDLKTIDELGLNNANLVRLSSFLEDKKEENDITCKKAKSSIMAFVMMAFHEIDKDILEHLCTCKKCSKIIYKYRESIRNELLIENKAKPCFLSGKLSYNEIMEISIPYGLDVNNYKQSTAIQSRISHIRRCPFCLEKIQNLQRIISDIQKRPNSSTVTKYYLEEENPQVSTDESKDIYQGFPVHVEISGAYEESASNSSSSINFTSALKNKILTPKSKLAFKTGFAGIFIFAAILSFMYISSPNAKALSLANLCESIENTNNIHISSFSTGQTEPVQEQWISRPLKMRIFKTRNDLSLWDIKGKSMVKKTLNSDISESETQIMSKEWLSNAEKSINSIQGFVPFYSISDIPSGAKWNKIDTESDAQNNPAESEIYELSYFSNTFGNSEYIKFRFILKPDTNLPERIEFYTLGTI